VGSTGQLAGAVALALVLVSGCGAARLSQPVREGPARAGVASADSMVMSAGDRTRLAALAAERAKTPAEGGYRIGPDDLLDIRIPDLFNAHGPASATRNADGAPAAVTGAPVFQEGARVSARGDLSLPYLGIVRAEGLTPAELEADVARRLVAAGILRTPQVGVQIVEYRSHVVAVIGSVERPGLYPLTRPRASIADLIAAAGGPSRDAGRVVDFVPARPETTAAAAAARAGLVLVGFSPSSSAGTAPLLAPVSPTDEGGARDHTPIRIDLELLLHATGSDASDLNPPVWPGDAINVAPAGSVLINGWVDKPGSYPVTRGLTVGGAIAAAGGPLFPADRRHVTVTRVVAGGGQRLITADLDAAAVGSVGDVPVTDGDVVQVPAVTARALSWGLWTLAREMVHIGGSVLLF